MPKFIITFEVEDLAAWEDGFRTHGALFRKQTVSGEIEIGIDPGANHVALYAEVKDPAFFWDALTHQDAIEAMANDGVKAETLRVHAVDRGFAV